jgi:pectate lyase
MALVMTYHHNFYDVCGSRMPRISFVSMHVYNTYFKEAQIDAIAAANGCSAFIQNNFFEKSHRPMISASQGHELTPSTSGLRGTLDSGEALRRCGQS